MVQGHVQGILLLHERVLVLLPLQVLHPWDYQQVHGDPSGLGQLDVQAERRANGKNARATAGRSARPTRACVDSRIYRSSWTFMRARARYGMVYGERRYGGDGQRLFLTSGIGTDALLGCLTGLLFNVNRFFIATNLITQCRHALQ